MVDVAGNLVRDGHEVVCDMEHFSKHWDRLLGVAAELQSPSRSARGVVPISPIAVMYRPMERARTVLDAVVHGLEDSEVGAPR